MKITKNPSGVYNINSDQLLKIFKKEKILILAISLLIAILFFVYGLTKTKQFVISTNIQTISKYTFYKFHNIIIHLAKKNLQGHTIISSSDFVEEYNSLFEKNLKSKKNLIIFLKLQKEIPKFTDKELNKYFDLKLVSIDKNNSIFYLTYPKSVDGKLLLNNYINYVKKFTTDHIVSIINLLVLVEIEKYEQDLQMSNAIIKPNSNLNNNFQSSNLNVDHIDAQEILEKKIFNLKQVLKSLHNDQINIFSSVHEISEELSLNKQNYYYIFLGLIVGFFLSFFIIFVRNF
jgi:hypothetical protein